MKKEIGVRREIDSHSVLSAILQTVSDYTQHVDVQVNSIVLLSSAVFIFSAQQYLGGGNKMFLAVLAVFSGVASVMGLLAVRPPAYMRKHGQNESLLYPRNIAGYESVAEYAEELRGILKNEQRVVGEYAMEIYNMSKYFYIPKRFFSAMARNFLILGIMASFVVFVFTASWGI